MSISARSPLILHQTAEHASNLPIDITMAATAEQPWLSWNRVSKAVWIQRIDRTTPASKAAQPLSNMDVVILVW